MFTKTLENLILPEVEVKVDENLAEIIITEQEVCKYLEQLDTTKAPGPDGVPTKVLKECANVLKKSLTKLFNLSVTLGSFPDIWKIAKVTPVYKKGEKKDIKNY